MLCRKSYLKNDYSYFPFDVVPVLATASASLGRILEDVQDDKASPSTYNGPPPPTLHTRTGTPTYARNEWLGQPCCTPDHGLPPSSEAMGSVGPGAAPNLQARKERRGLPCRTPDHGLLSLFGGHRPSSTFHATPPRAVLHGPLATCHNCANFRLRCDTIDDSGGSTQRHDDDDKCAK